ncbi:MAG: TIR domain-containing protein [Planctomycetota bacterium]
MTDPLLQPEAKPADERVRRVFISYSTRDRDLAIDVARAIESTGWYVWMDRWSLIGGTRFEPEIHRALETSMCTVVLWSRNSAESRWVRPEGDVALLQGTLVPVQLDATDPPWKADGIHVIDMQGWSSADLGHESFRTLLRSIAARFGDVPVPEPDPRRLTSHFRRQYRDAIRLGVVVLLCAGILAWATTTFEWPPAFLAFLAVIPGLLLWLPIPGRVAAVVHRTREFAVSWTGQGLLLVALLVVSCFGPVVVELDPAHHWTLEFGLSSPGTAVDVASGRIANDDPRWHAVLPSSPLGRRLEIHVDGYETAAVTVGAFRGARVAIPGDSLIPRPVVIMRVPQVDLSKMLRAKISVTGGGRTLAEASIDTDFGAIILGPDALSRPDLQDLVPGWRSSLEGLGTDTRTQDRILARWQRAHVVNWSERPALDATIQVAIDLPDEEPPLRYKTVTLNGPLTDVLLARE